MATDTCRHCGAVLPIVHDAFCSACHGPLDDDSPHPAVTPLKLVGNATGRGVLESFTVPARIVIVLSMVAAVIGTSVYMGWIRGDLPAGRYPLWFFAMPVVVAVGFLCAAGLALLRLCGVPIYRQESVDPAKPVSPEREEPRHA